MNYCFFDTSVVVKRYVHEAGSDFVRNMIVGPDLKRVVLSEISLAETAAAFSAKHRASDGITEQQRDSALKLFLQHCATEYRLVAVTRNILNRAIVLTQAYRLRGCDSIQLATALLTNETLISNDLAPLSFAAADNDLLHAAAVEGLAIEALASE